MCWFVLWNVMDSDQCWLKVYRSWDPILFSSAIHTLKLWSSNEKLRIHTENLEELCTAEASSPTHSGCEMKSINGIQRILHATESLSNEVTDFPPQFLLSAQFLGSLHSSCPKAISSFGWVCKIVQTLQAILPRHTVYSKFILIQVYVQL